MRGIAQPSDPNGTGGPILTSLEVATQYLDAWNAHDADAIVRTFAPGGTYHDPTTAGDISGDAIGANAGLREKMAPVDHSKS